MLTPVISSLMVTSPSPLQSPAQPLLAWHRQASAHSAPASLAQVASQRTSQHALSRSQTQLSQVESEHPDVSRSAQQSLAVSHVQRAAHSTCASSAQVWSHVSVQQLSSNVHTHSWQVGSSHPTSSCWVQHGPLTAQLHMIEHSFCPSLAQVASQLSLQHDASRSQTQLSHDLSSQPTPGCSAQQSPASGHAQLTAHSTPASSAQVLSQSMSQQVESMPHTQAWHVASLHCAPACWVQQSPPGVGVGPGVSVGAGSHGQLSRHSSDASETQVASQDRLQHGSSMPHTHVWHT